MRVFSVPALAFLCLFVPVRAFSSPQDDQDKLEDLRHRLHMLETLRELDETVFSLQQNLRNTGGKGELLKDPGTTDLLERSTELVGELADGLKYTPKGPPSAADREEIARRVAAARELKAHIRKLRSGKVDTWSPQMIRDFSLMLKVLHKTVGGGRVKAFGELNTKALDRIAGSAEVIEKSTREKNWAIDEVERTLYQTDPAKFESHALDDAIDTAWEGIRDLERAISAKDYAKVAAAEEHCAEGMKTTLEAIRRYRYQLGKFRRAIAELEGLEKNIEARARVLANEIAAGERELPLLAAEIKAAKEPGEAQKRRDRYTRRKGMVTANKETLKALRKRQEETRSTVKRRLDWFRVQVGKRLRFLKRFDDCVAKRLQAEEFSDRQYVRDHFPHYAPRERRPENLSVELLGPIPYGSKGHSPFNGMRFEYFEFENFEDHLLNVPGVTLSNGVVSGSRFGMSSIIDSVEVAEDKDGKRTKGDSWWSTSPLTISFEVKKPRVPRLPTHVGLVWTDGKGKVTFEAFDARGVSLGTVSGVHADGDHYGKKGEDRFYGVIHKGGISKVTLRNSGALEIDHLQYGAVPEGDE